MVVFTWLLAGKGRGVQCRCRGESNPGGLFLDRDLAMIGGSDLKNFSAPHCGEGVPCGATGGPQSLRARLQNKGSRAGGQAGDGKAAESKGAWWWFSKRLLASQARQTQLRAHQNNTSSSRRLEVSSHGLPPWCSLQCGRNEGSEGGCRQGKRKPQGWRRVGEGEKGGKCGDDGGQRGSAQLCAVTSLHGQMTDIDRKWFETDTYNLEWNIHVKPAQLP